ncbi:MAG: cupin domain-containing protein [Actinomycetota bacterium]
MATGRPEPVDLHAAFDRLTFVADRTPESADHEIADAFARLADTGAGAVFIAHYAGDSQWERHGHGDEYVAVVEGSTEMTMIVDGDDLTHTMTAGQFVIVPQGTWHRFHTPEGVKVMTITPQPTDHSPTRPID